MSGGLPKDQYYLIKAKDKDLYLTSSGGVKQDSEIVMMGGDASEAIWDANMQFKIEDGGKLGDQDTVRLKSVADNLYVTTDGEILYDMVLLFPAHSSLKTVYRHDYKTDNSKKENDKAKQHFVISKSGDHYYIEGYKVDVYNPGMQIKEYANLYTLSSYHEHKENNPVVLSVNYGKEDKDNFKFEIIPVAMMQKQQKEFRENVGKSLSNKIKGKLHPRQEMFSDTNKTKKIIGIIYVILVLLLAGFVSYLLFRYPNGMRNLF